MAKITITFQEEGQPSTTIEIPAAIGDVLDQHIALLQSEGQQVSGKTELFARMTWANWLRPILSRHGHDVISLAGETGQQAAELEAQLAQARAAEEMAAVRAVVRRIEEVK